MNALSKEDVGKYVNRFFVSSFQRVGTFAIGNNGRKQGGNVAAYFCAPNGRVLHIVAGPVDNKTFLREARWAVELVKFTQLQEIQSLGRLRAFFQRAHLDRVLNEYQANVRYLPIGMLPPERVKNYLRRLRGVGSANQRKVHFLLANYPLAKIGTLHAYVFEHILGEDLSVEPVRVGHLPTKRMKR